MSTIADDLMDQVFQLAYFIHGDKALARHITLEAMLRLEAMLLAQDKRRYYAATTRTKVCLSELHVLQRLTYMLSERYEQEQERSGKPRILDEDDMIIRFIKHLIQITLKRNSFYVTLGLSRLLYAYTTPEVMRLYDVISQDPDSLKEDYYFRECKQKLMKELQQRFGSALKIGRGIRGETKFESEPTTDENISLVRECLNRFTPWKTPCVVPHQFNPLFDRMSHLTFDGGEPDDEHSIEINRIHSTIHPDCLTRLTESLTLDSPDQRLAIPRFFLANSGSDSMKPPRSRHQPSHLSDEERLAIRHAVTHQASRRKTAPAELLSIRVDDVERARLDLRQTQHVQLNVEEGAEMMEVYTSDNTGDVLLAVYVLTFDDAKTNARPMTSSIVLEGGQEISFGVSFIRGGDDTSQHALVDISYRENNVVKAVALLCRQLMSRISQAIHPPNLNQWPALKAGLAVGLALTMLGSLIWYMQRPSTTRQPVIVQQPPSATEPQSRPQPDIPAAPEPPPTTPAPPTDIAANPKTENERFILRESANQSVESLLAVRRIYVYPFGSDAFSQQLRESLINRLQAGNRFTITENSDEADAALKATMSQVTPEPNTADEPRADSKRLAVRLVNADGEIIWPTRQTNSRGRYRGTAETIAEQMVNELVGDIRRLERRPRGK
jgi:hypothetical protein